MLSCMLGVVHRRGSTVQQAADVLKRSATGDWTYPDAWFWFSVTGDVRVKTRITGMLEAKDMLTHLGRKNASTLGTVPDKSGSCVGLMLGAATFKLSNRGWNFVPGALADNLTSHGGNYILDGQTKLTALLHAGAAISSGTVTEPYSLQPKFPHPSMYAYYGAGCTAIESFYLSVAAPYQLLIVGDPLAQPYALPPLDDIDIRDEQTANSDPIVVLSRKSKRGRKSDPEVGAIEVYVEGKLANRVPTIPNIRLKLPTKLRGAVDIRAVVVGDDPLESKRAHQSWVSLARGSNIPRALATRRATRIEVECVEAESIDLLHMGQVIGSIDGSRGIIEIDPQQIGGGPVRLRPVAKFGDVLVPGRPITIDLPIELPQPAGAK